MSRHRNTPKNYWGRVLTVIFLFFFAVVLMSGTRPTQTDAQNACIEGDANGDGKVTLADYSVWRKIFMAGAPSVSPTTPPSSAACPAGGITVSPGQSIQQVIDTNPTQSVICVKAGTYREDQIDPKEGDTIVGEGETTILNGSRLLTNFQSEGALWYVDGQTQEGQVHGECDKVIRCDHPEDTFINDQALLHVPDKSQVGPGKWFFDYPANRIYIADNPAGKKIETSVVRHAIYGGGQNGVTVKNLVIEKYANPTQFGAIQNGDFAVTGGNNWTVDNVVARLNHGTGIGFFSGSNNTVQNSKMVYNGQKGLGMGGTDAKVLHNEIAFNNFQHAVSTGWEAGGSKFANTDGLLVQDNYVHHNFGPGLWTDIDNINTTYDHNLVTDNEESGIFHEISYKATIKNNTVLRNGFQGPGWCYGAGILASASRDVEVFNNVVQANYHSIIGLQQQRGSGAYGAHEVQNLNVHDNYIESGTDHHAQTGVCADYATGIDTTWNNHFTNNSYYGTTNTWAWNSQEITNFTQWQGFGNDVSGKQVPGAIPANLFITR
ncbi:right-handed parallel beta-helix repeat-containing protein [Candidatus Microgenomates bacterium]|nr:right-handed parallel beta-helix repeat-containing protein [Candidatus Microgenomates bacterium]